MTFIPALLKSGWNRWWGVGLLVAAPALALAVLGLRAVRAERIEREQQLLEQQAQSARLADGALANLFEDLARRLRLKDGADQTAIESSFTLLSLDRSGVLRFMRERVYFGDSSEHQAAWPAKIEILVEEAQAAEAQQRAREAAFLYRRIRDAEPRLREWAEMCTTRIGHRLGDPSATELLASGRWSRTQDLSPDGMPIALVACADIARLSEGRRPAFMPLLEGTLENLRAGQWWLSYDERRFYDEELRRLFERSGGPLLSGDARLDEMAAVDEIVRKSPPVRRDAITRNFDRGEHGAFLIVWAAGEDRGGWLGLAISESKLGPIIDACLEPLLAGIQSRPAIRDAQGRLVWGESTGPLHAEPLLAVPGWELTFSTSTRAGWIDRRRVLWLGFVMGLVVMLMAGVAMTAWVARREADLARMQNEFIAGVTHEFKSPITSVRLLLERLSSGRLGPAQSAGEYYRAIDGEIDRLERHVNRLLEAQKIQEGHREYCFAPASPVAVTRTAIEELRPQAEARGINLETTVDGEIPDAWVDGSALTDAVENLLDNERGV